MTADNNRKFDQLELNSDVFAFQAVESHIDLKRMIGDAASTFHVPVLHHNIEPDDEEKGRTILMVKSKSTQGLDCILLKSGVFTISIPEFASKTDVMLCYALLREAKKQCEPMLIYQNDDNTIADLSDDAERETFFYRLDNMAKVIEQQDDHIGIKGVNHLFHIFPTYIKQQQPYAKPEAWTYKAYEDFASVEWDYEDYPSVDPAKIIDPSGEEYTARFVSNMKCFVGVCQKIVLCESDGVKITDAEDFYKATSGNAHIHRLDFAQFTLDPMSDEDWKQLMDRVPGDYLTHPKTYILRWNPTISSFKLEHYRKACAYHDGFNMNWSIYEWEKAKKGDRFYMERLGDDGRGIVFRGPFTSDPYLGEDWAGTSKKRYYVDIDCFDASPADGQPQITLEELKSILPEINWDKGHSGQLLTEGQAQKLEELWDSKMEA